MLQMKLYLVAEQLMPQLSNHYWEKLLLLMMIHCSLGGIGMLGTEPSSDAMEEADTLLMIGTSFPYIEYLPKPGQATGIQIDAKPERIGLRYPLK